MKRILVCLSLESFDQNLVSYVSNLGGILNNSELHLVHVISKRQYNVSIPELEETNDLSGDGFDADDLRRHALKMGLKGADTAVSAVLKGSLSTEILRYIHTCNIDLVFLGKRFHDYGSGHLATQLASRSTASLWVVPHIEVSRLHHVLLATDFSRSSQNAYQCATMLKSYFPDFRELSIITSYSVPAGYFKTGLTFDQMSEKLYDATEKGLKGWLSEQNMIKGVSMHPIVALEDRSTAGAIIAAAEEKNVDLILMGSRGHSAVTAFLVGSTTDEVLRKNHRFPVYVARNTEEGERRLLKELFRIE
jgi:nucleotide-binding universal stress UspA family protein